MRRFLVEFEIDNKRGDIMRIYKKNFVLTVLLFLFSFSSLSFALTVQDPDNETAGIYVYTNVYVAPTKGASYSDYGSYSNTVNDGNGGKAKVSYLKDYSATDGEIHVVSVFSSNGSATESSPNIKTSNKITYNSVGGTFTGTEKIGYQRCQPASNINFSSFCGTANQSLPSARGDMAMGSSFNVKSAAITTQSSVTAVGDSKTLTPSMDYSIDVGGLGADGQKLASGSVKTGMALNLTENPGNNPTTTEQYEDHTSASGLITFSKHMKYNSSIANIPSLNTNFNKVP